MLAKFRGFEWLCPIRTCGRIVPTLKGLGGHFSVCLLLVSSVSFTTFV